MRDKSCENVEFSNASEYIQKLSWTRASHAASDFYIVNRFWHRNLTLRKCIFILSRLLFERKAITSTAQILAQSSQKELQNQDVHAELNEREIIDIFWIYKKSITITDQILVQMSQRELQTEKIHAELCADGKPSTMFPPRKLVKAFFASLFSHSLCEICARICAPLIDFLSIEKSRWYDLGFSKSEI